MADTAYKGPVVTEDTDGQGTELTKQKAGTATDRQAGAAAPVRKSKRQTASAVSAERSKRVRTGRAGAGNRRRKGGRQSLPESFGHAFEGIGAGLKERNMRIHCTVAVLVVIFGILLRITVTEWCICLVLFGLIMGLELVNTAVEAVVDLATQDYHPLAKKAKDTAAGAVLIASIMAAIAGLIIFVPRLFLALGIHVQL